MFLPYETGTSTKMTRLRGRCLKGQRLYARAPFGHWLTQTFVAGLRYCGLTAPWVIDGPMTRQIFETYGVPQLAPTLSKGDVVILDNLPAHKSETKLRGVCSNAAPGFCSCQLRQSRFEPDRAGLRQDQSTSAQSRSPHL